MSTSRTLLSARERQPSGRTNAHVAHQTAKDKSVAAIREPAFSPSSTLGNTFANNSQRTIYTGTISDGPFSARYADPVVHEPPPSRTKRLLHCPEDYPRINEEHELSLNIPRLNRLSAEDRADFLSSFIERNSENMWKYDPTFRGRGVQEIYETIYNKKEFGSVMAKYCNLEKKFSLSTASDNIRSCMQHGRAVPVHQPKHDPFIHTLTTSRTDREQRVNALFAPAMSQYVNMNPRGEPHGGEWGNFSSFVGHLKKNEMAMLKR